MEFRYQAGEDTVAVRVEADGARYRITVGDQVLSVESVTARDGELRLTLDGQRLTAWAAADGPRRWVALGARTYTFAVPAPEKRARRGHGAGPKHDTLEAQMPGVIRKVLVAAGEAVERGQALVVVEAMKMEIRVAAPHAGRVEAVAVREGETIQRGQVLVELIES